MGNLLAKRRAPSPCKPHVVVENTTDSRVDVWCDGGGPVAIIEPGAHAKVFRSHAAKWEATHRCKLREGLGALKVAEWQLRGKKIGTQQLKNAFPPGKAYPGAQLVLRVTPVSPQELYRLKTVTEVQRLYRKRAGARREHERKLRAFRRKRTAKTLQTAARRLLPTIERRCPICLEDLPWAEFAPMCHRPVQGGNPFKARAEHRACKGCLRAHVKHELADDRIYVRCPGVSCGTLLLDTAIRDRADQGEWRALMDRLSAAQATRLVDEKDKAFLAFCASSARRCPRCQVIIWRSAGCDHMSCRCGHMFNWTSETARIVVQKSK